MGAPKVADPSPRRTPDEILAARIGSTSGRVDHVIGPHSTLADVSKSARNSRLRQESGPANPEPWRRHSMRSLTGVRSTPSLPAAGDGARPGDATLEAGPHGEAVTDSSDNEADGGESVPSVAEERDQAAEQRDQAADHRDDAGDQRDQAGVERDQAAEQRDQTGEHRDEAGDHRDQAGDERDQTAQQRDQAADQRDQDADRRDKTAEQSEESAPEGITADVLTRSALARQEAASDRRRASLDRRAGASERCHAELDRSTALADRGAGASERTQAELDRSTALADRGAGASERNQAELDRSTALADRGASARERECASMDDLTGAYLRGAGFVELEREMARARRTQQPLVVAFVDVDHLKAINDSHGHAAGDRVLLEVANALAAKLRSYDLIIRYGGDEFVCAVSGLNMADTGKRLAAVNTVLAESLGDGSVTVGLAELRPEDSAGDLVARADSALYRERRGQRRDIVVDVGTPRF